MKSSLIPTGFLCSAPAHFFALGFEVFEVAEDGGVALFGDFDRGMNEGGLDLPLQVAVVSALFVFGCYICEIAGQALGVPDHGGIVWDEIVAFCVVLMTVPERWGWWLAAFAAFRFFDIVKPAPIGWLDKHFKNGFGVMVDDLMAAAYAAGLLAFARNLI